MSAVEESPRDLGRYVLYDQIASGGMATVHFGRMHGAIGFSRLVAIKRLHRNFVTDAHFVQMFLDEARLAARLDHPNVVSTIDVVADESEVFLVMEHILGESLEALMPRAGSKPVPLPIASAIMCNVLEGLHSAHETKDDGGTPLGLVHRDVSPHNVLVGVDGIAKVFDFGIAKAATNTQETREGVVKGKVTYMAPEQVWGTIDRRADIYAAGVILWELIAGRRRHAGERNDSLFLKLAKNDLEAPEPPSSLRGDATAALDEVVARATHPQADHRFATAREMAVALEAAVMPAPARSVAEWLREVAGERIDRRSAVMRRIEADVQGPSSIDAIAVPGSSSTGSVRVVTGSLSRSGVVATNSMPPSVMSGPPRWSAHPEPPRRSWTLPAALLAFTTAMLLVGLRVYSKHPTHAPPEPDIAVGAAAHEAASTANITSSSSNGAPAAGDPTTANPGAAASVAIGPASGDGGKVLPAAFQAARTWHPAVAAQPAVRVPARGSDPTPAPTPGRVDPASPPNANAGHKPGCESPFAIGPDGIRQIKPECM
ncbi:MAG TPA: protein kinase [Labilithrix sp.]|nr:protein kinase [Labilithrix sp.]